LLVCRDGGCSDVRQQLRHGSCITTARRIPVVDTWNIEQSPIISEASGPGPEVMAAEALSGNAVYNMQGERLGDVEAIMLDVVSGTVAYAVLRTGGFMGIGARLLAIPWPALQLDSDDHTFWLDLDAERLASAPDFDRNHWPSMTDTQWAWEVHAFFGQRPYWYTQSFRSTNASRPADRV
jgi:sporulation protein YlmC with PRC-barrel domain